jgi:hypothetical protein
MLDIITFKISCSHVFKIINNLFKIYNFIWCTVVDRGTDILISFAIIMQLSLSMVLQLFGPWPLFHSFVYTQLVGLLGREISPSQGLYLHTEQHKHKINARRHPCLK